eukprot:TRINITY_DN56914_c0_g1_i1.p1 TRINITY_DN56914_c0_g1~~TRINITY_DN56914_c0_g1_i1.p1  ORF type:complete len:362 (-),score=25.81 TRINITY_DN56914_c0_g1_i1:172-1185(-)
MVAVRIAFPFVSSVLGVGSPMPVVFGTKGFDFEPTVYKENIVSYLEVYSYEPVDANRWRFPSAAANWDGNIRAWDDDDDESATAIAAACDACSHPWAAVGAYSPEIALPRWERAPRLDLGVLRHVEMGGCRWYVLACALTFPENRDAGAKVDVLKLQPVKWQPKRRLTHLRSGLHDPVKREFGASAYEKCFRNTPFDDRGFTTSLNRLGAWLGSLAACINSGEAPPRIVALALQFLEVPVLGAPPPLAHSDIGDFLDATEAATEAAVALKKAGDTRFKEGRGVPPKVQVRTSSRYVRSSATVEVPIVASSNAPSAPTNTQAAHRWLWRLPLPLASRA